MYIAPTRRRRILKAHHLRQQGKSLRTIAEQLNVAPATIHADLKLVESNWSEIAAPAADDLLLNQLHLLQRRLTQVINQEIVPSFTKRLEPDEYARLYAVHTAEFATLLRETRRTINAIHRRAEQRPEQEVEITEYLERPVEEAVEPPAPSDPELNKTEHSEQRISQPEQEIVKSGQSEKNSTEQAEHSLPDNIVVEAQAFLEQLREQEFHTAHGVPTEHAFADAAAGG